MVTEVTISVEKDLIVQGDLNLLNEVLRNLLSNAWKYTSKVSDPEIKFGVTNKDGKVYFVKDNGVGFDIRHADKLFGVFQTLHANNEYEGLGVGLAIVRRIVSLHGGRVWVESQVNVGSTFYFTLEG